MERRQVADGITPPRTVPPRGLHSEPPGPNARTHPGSREQERRSRNRDALNRSVDMILHLVYLRQACDEVVVDESQHAGRYRRLPRATARDPYIGFGVSGKLGADLQEHFKPRFMTRCRVCFLEFVDIRAMEGDIRLDQARLCSSSACKPVKARFANILFARFSPYCATAKPRSTLTITMTPSSSQDPRSFPPADLPIHGGSISNPQRLDESRRVGSMPSPPPIL